MDRRKLAEAYDALRSLLIPPPPDSDELEEWRAGLIEMDGFYAGIASTVLNGGYVEDHLEDLQTLAATLQTIRLGTDRDRETYEASRMYLECLQKLREAFGDAP